jgi:20S proteasome subunit alpha 4
MQAVAKGAVVAGVKGADCVVLGVERKAVAKLQDPRTVRKIVRIDANTTAAFAGLTADARVLIRKARVEAQSYRLTVEDNPSVEYMARFIARQQQKHTVRGGVRPYGITCVIAGLANDGTPELWQSDPSGNYSAWRATTTGRNQKATREYLEKNYPADGEEPLTREQSIKLAITALCEVVDSSSKSIEVSVLEKGKEIAVLSDEAVEAVCKTIEAEKEAAAASRSGSRDQD